MDKEELHELTEKLSEFLKKKQSEQVSYCNDSHGINFLRDKCLSFLKTETFKVGDIVKWKKGLKNKKYPKDDQLGFVMELINPPIFENTKDSGSPYFREPLDLILAAIDDDAQLMLYHYDKRRFKLVERTVGN